MAVVAARTSHSLLPWVQRSRRKGCSVTFLAALVTLALMIRVLATQQEHSSPSFLFSSTSSPLSIVSTTTTMSSHVSNNENCCNLARRHSFGFFSDIPDGDWVKFYQQPAREAEHYHSLHNSNTTTAAEWNFFNWDPYFYCPHIRKIGGLQQGGSKWTCDVERLAGLKHDCLVYSVGSRGNFEFEMGLNAYLAALGISKRCEIHVFDMGEYSAPSASATGRTRSQENQQQHIHYHQWGLKSTYSLDYRRQAIKRGVPFKTFQETRQLLGHQSRTIDIFKIDCESCEWHTYKDWIGEDIRQILMETHEIPLRNSKRMTDFGIFPTLHPSEFFDTFQRNGFVLFSKEVNSQRGLGRSVEWSFIKMHDDFLALSDH